ncbi:MAG TPA: nuclear transport factor 2 family protein [Allosphingosinicella sp.]|jgi:ketosteroid isomerase-like protein|nr:nuclear transport factor 2 family protein [Allosphingosinicella sp.]
MLWLAALLMAANPGSAETCQNPAAAVAAKIIEVDAAYRRAWIGPDLLSISERMADDWTIIHANGRQQTKAQFLDAIRSGRVRFLETKLSEQFVRIHERVAILTARAHNRIAFGGRESEGDVRLTAVYACHAGIWKVVAEQATGIESSPPSSR